MRADDFQTRRAEAIAAGRDPVPGTLQGVSKERVKQVLGQIALATTDRIDLVFALLDDTLDSCYRSAPDGSRFCSGASVADLGCHVGILQRGGGKSDREAVRDYWLKPLVEIGAIDRVTLVTDSDRSKFVSGHVKAKSANSAYRLSPAFLAILRAKEGAWQKQLNAWTAGDAQRERLSFRAALEVAAAKAIDNAHARLIEDAALHYAPRFLPGFEVIYVDNGDGQRITDNERADLKRAGLEWTLADAMPDVLLWNPKTDALWIIEAVTSDGEVDATKVQRLTDLAKRHGKHSIGFTTAFLTYKEFSARQTGRSNIAVGTWVWVREVPDRLFHVGAKH